MPCAVSLSPLSTASKTSMIPAAAAAAGSSTSQSPLHLDMNPSNDGLVISGLVHINPQSSGNSSSSSPSPSVTCSKRSPKVLLSVHRTCTEHFAVIYPTRISACARKPMATINLRVSRVSASPYDEGVILIRSKKDADGICLRIKPLVTGSTPLEDWIRALSPTYNQSSSSPSCPSSPDGYHFYPGHRGSTSSTGSSCSSSPLPLITEELEEIAAA